MAILSIWQLTFACASKNLVFVQQQLPKQWEKCGQFWPKTDVCLRLCNYKRNAGNFGQKHVARLHSKRLGLAGCLQRVTRWAFWFVYFHFCICVFQLVHLYLCICNCVFVVVYLYWCICICVFVFVYCNSCARLRWHVAHHISFSGTFYLDRYGAGAQAGIWIWSKIRRF